MSTIRLPVCGDYILGRLVVGVSVDHAADLSATVVIWAGAVGDGSFSVRQFQEIHLDTGEEAVDVREKIIGLAKLEGLRLPGGDMVRGELVSGVSVNGTQAGPCLVSVWVSDFQSDGKMFAFTHLEASDLEEALAYRDYVVVHSGLGAAVDETAFDSEREAAYYAPVAGGGGDDDDGEGGNPSIAVIGVIADQVEPCAPTAVVLPSACRMSVPQMKRLLDGWRPHTPAN